MRDYLNLLRCRPAFRTLWLSETVSLLGDWFTVVAVSLLTLGGGDRIVLLALSFIAHTLPQALLAPLAGPLADFVDRRRSLLMTAWAEALITVGMVASALYGNVALLPALVLLRSVLGAMREPAANAALPRLVEEDEVIRANALLSLTWSATFAIGMGLGGLVAGYRPDLALAIDAVSFAVAGTLLFFLPPIPPETSESRAPRLRVGPLLAGMWEAATTLRDPSLRRAVFGKASVAVAGGGGWVVMNLVTRAHPFLGSAGVTLGVLQGLRGLSTGIGPVVAERFIARGARPALVAVIAVGAAFAGVATFELCEAPWALAFGAFVWGAGAGCNWVLTTSNMQRESPRGFVGRLSSIDNLSWAVGMCSAAVVTAWVAERTHDASTAALFVVGIGVALEVVLQLSSAGPSAKQMVEDP